ncbi:tyrosine phosphatase-like protein [Cyathus striatus]|nr:tyrosine phosphatase-like protein [Cyathus striatus]
MGRDSSVKQKAARPKSQDGFSLDKAYLVAYNASSALGWGYILVIVLTHLLNLNGASDVVATQTSSTATSQLYDFLLSKLSILKTLGILSTDSLKARLPSLLQLVYSRATTAYSRIGPQTAFVQSFAILEVIHVLLGWVRSPLPTTVMQISSRLFLVWGIVEQFPEVRTNPLYASMVLAWSMTEVIRYTFYACSLLGVNSGALLYLRYSTFYVLYPLGASSEAFLIYATLPSFSSTLGWKATDYVRAVLFSIWWPGLYVMYTHMMRQRGKVIERGLVLKGERESKMEVVVL